MQKQYGSEPASVHNTITASNTVAVTPTPRCLYVATAGDLVITDSANTTVTYAVTAGTILPFRPTYIRTTSTAVVIGWL